MHCAYSVLLLPLITIAHIAYVVLDEGLRLRDTDDVIRAIK